MSPHTGFAFGPYELDVRSRRLLRAGAPVNLSPRQLDMLLLLVQHAGKVVSKDALMAAAWGNTIVSDNSVERMLSNLRAALDPQDRKAYILSKSRQGYEFIAPVTAVETANPIVDVDALLAPFRAWVEGRAALESLERDQIAHARVTFERLVADHPHQASLHIGFANALALAFESTRTDPAPNVDWLRLAVHEARLACQLNDASPEAWATLGRVLQRTDPPGALAALERAVTMEPEVTAALTDEDFASGPCSGTGRRRPTCEPRDGVRSKTAAEASDIRGAGGPRGLHRSVSRSSGFAAWSSRRPMTDGAAAGPKVSSCTRGVLGDRTSDLTDVDRLVPSAEG